MESEVPPTQVIVDDDEDVDDQGKSSPSGGDEEEEQLSPLKQSGLNAFKPINFGALGTRPLERTTSFAPWREEPEDEIDIQAYLEQFDLPPASQIAICRTYANYLAANSRPRAYKKNDRQGGYKRKKE